MSLSNLISNIKSDTDMLKNEKEQTQNLSKKRTMKVVFFSKIKVKKSK